MEKSLWTNAILCLCMAISGENNKMVEDDHILEKNASWLSWDMVGRYGLGDVV